MIPSNGKITYKGNKILCDDIIFDYSYGNF